MKKILSILGSVCLIGTSTVTVIACNANTETFDNLKDINDYIKRTDLGNFSSEPTNQTILTRFNRWNRDFEEFDGHFEVENITLIEQREYELHYQATIKVKEGSTIYKKTSTAVVSYIVKNDPRTDLDAFTKEIQLGSFRNKPTKTDILTRVIEKNPELNQKEIEVVKVGSNYAEINAVKTSKLYWGYTYVYFVEKIDLTTWNLDTVLGDFVSEPTEQELFSRFESKNPRRLKLNQFEVIRNTEQGTLIGVISDSKYYYHFEFELTYFVGRQNLEKVITVTDLDLFDFYVDAEYWRDLSEWNQKQILDRVQQLNPDFQADQAFIFSFEGIKSEIESEIIYQFVIHPKPDSLIYLGSVVLTYTYILDAF